MKDCDVCKLGMSKPLVNQVIFLTNFRQMLVFWQNTVQLICYESDSTTASGGGGIDTWRGSQGAKSSQVQQKLPVDHNFSFHKVAMDSYAVNWRQAQRSDHQHMLPAGDSDFGEEDDYSVEGCLGAGYDCTGQSGGG